MKASKVFLAGIAVFLMSACNSQSKEGSQISQDMQESTQQDGSNESQVAEQEAVPFKFDMSKDAESVDFDGIECSFTFNIDWPAEGSPAVLKSIRQWIIKTTVGQPMDIDNVTALRSAIISKNSENGYIGVNVTVKINDKGSEIAVESSTDWSAGYSVSSPWGKTTYTGVFNASTGQLISEDVVREGEDDM